MKTCSVVGCQKEAKASRGWCWGHYQRWIKYGDPVAGFRQAPCSVDQCDRPSRSSGMCDMHYRRMVRHGDPNVRLTMQGGTCIEDGCDERSFGHGLCQNHYYKLWVDAGGRKLKAAAIARRRALVTGAEVVDRDLSWVALWESGLRLCDSCAVRCDPDDHTVIINRAGRQQKICGPTYPSLDHVIPLSAGGEHTATNAALLCLDCNRRKCARVDRPEHDHPGSASQGDSTR